MKRSHLKSIMAIVAALTTGYLTAQWQPNWYPLPNWNNTFASSTPVFADATPWAVGGNQVGIPTSNQGSGLSPGNGNNYSVGTADGAPFALLSNGTQGMYMDMNQRMAIGANHLTTVGLDCQLDIRGSGSNFRIYGNSDGYVTSTSHMKLFYNNNNIAGTANFEVNQGTPTSPTIRFSIDGNGYTSIYEDLRVGSASWNAAGRLIVDGLNKNGIVIRADNGNTAMNICNNNGVGKFLMRINAGGGDNAEFRLVGRTQIGFYQSPGWIIDPSTQLNVDGTTAHGVKVSTNNSTHKMFYVENSTVTNTNPFVVYGDGKTQIGNNFPDQTGVAAGAMLSVNGMILAKEVRVAISSGPGNHWAWPDFVFDNEYKLLTLNEVEKYVRENKHLPGVPSEAEVKKEGVDLLQMNIQLLQKLEELYLHVIEIKKRIDEQDFLINKTKEN